MILLSSSRDNNNQIFINNISPMSIKDDKNKKYEKNFKIILSKWIV